MTIDRKEVGNRLKAIRMLHGMTQAEIGKIASVTPQQWSRYEAGMDTIGAEALTLVCSRFSLSADVILGLRARSREPIPPIV